MSWDYVTLLVVLAVSYLGHVYSVVWAAAFLLLLKVAGLTQWFPAIEAHGLNWGIILLTVAILVPIANGKITLPIMLESFRTPMGLFAILAGIFASISGGLGVQLLRASPEVISALIVGTMVGVLFCKGITIGPLIAAGLVYMMLSVAQLFK